MATKPFTQFRADIEGMRAIAVVLVVIFHAKLGVLSGGFIGVDVFFAISGYLITGLILAEYETKGKLDFVAFYARRGRRLIPAVTAMLIVVLFISYFIYAPDEILDISKSGAFSSVYISNFYFAMLPKGYFSTHVAENPFLHTWSLSVEEQFYLFWPLFIVLGAKLTRSRHYLLALLSATTLASFLLGLWLVEHHLNWGFYSLPGRVWEFGLGGVVRILVGDPTRLPKIARTLVGWTGLGLILASSVLLTEWVRFPGWPAVLPILGTVMVLGVGGQGSVLDKVLGLPVLQWLGRRSYALYLWHWPFFVLPAIWFGELGLWHKLICLAGSVLVAHISYHLIENPVRRHPWLITRKFASIVLTGGLAVFAGSSVIAAYLGAKVDLRQNPIYETYREIGFEHPPAFDGRWECLVWPPSNPNVEACEFATDGMTGLIVVAGDSHSQHWFSPILEITKDQDYRITSLMKAGCPFADVEVYDAVRRVENVECKIWREAATEQLIALKPRIAIISMASGAHVAGTAAWGDQEIGVGINDWGDGLARALAPLGEAGIPVLLIQHTPKLSTHGPTCLARTVRFGRDAEHCARDRSEALDQEILDVERTHLAQLPGVTLLDLSDAFCDSEKCYGERRGISVYRDVHHVSEAWALSLRPQLEEAIGSVLIDDL